MFVVAFHARNRRNEMVRTFVKNFYKKKYTMHRPHSNAIIVDYPLMRLTVPIRLFGTKFGMNPRNEVSVIVLCDQMMILKIHSIYNSMLYVEVAIGRLPRAEYRVQHRFSIRIEVKIL